MNVIQGYPVVLTADRTLLSNYDLLFDGMLAASQTTTTPRFIMDRLLLPPMPTEHARARLAPLGLRRVEAALLQAGFRTEEVIITPGERLNEVVGPATRIIAVSSGDPLGRGMNSNTMTAIAGGMGYPEAEFRRLLSRVQQARKNAPGAKVLAGGPGAWQLADDPASRRELGIDHLVNGYCEGNIAQVFHALLQGEAQPEIITGQGVPAEKIPGVFGATVMGAVEISRGCGLGCAFCTLAGMPMLHLPERTIIADAAMNIEAGMVNLSLLSRGFLPLRRGGHAHQPESIDLPAHPLTPPSRIAHAAG